MRPASLTTSYFAELLKKLLVKLYFPGNLVLDPISLFSRHKKKCPGMRLLPGESTSKSIEYFYIG